MVFYKNNKWNIAEYRIKYRDGEEVTEKNVGQEGIDWWVRMEERWEHIEILNLEDVVPTEEELQRLDDINHIGIEEGYSGLVDDYVKLGKFPAEHNHPLIDIELKTISQEHGVSLSQREIESMQLAMQVSELEIAMMKLGGV